MMPLKPETASVLYTFPSAMYPITIRIFGRSGAEVWTHVVTLAAARAHLPIGVPGFYGTEHHPVTVRVEYADGSADDTKEIN